MLRQLLPLVLLVRLAQATLVNLNASPATGKQILEKTKFDYIIVGGGTAGLTVAKRLVDASKSVLVLEAGGSGVGSDLVTIPKNSFAFVGTDIDWLFTISAQEHAAGQEINLSSGKILGGDSSINGLVWVRPSKAEYDAYETLGSSGWNWNNLYNAMVKSETLNVPSSELVNQYGYTVEPSSHGKTGPVDVSFPPFLPLQHTKLIEASLEVGHSFNADPYKGNNTGVFFSLSSQKPSPIPTRETSEFAYINTVINKTSLVVLSFATVSSINLEKSGSSYKSTGVQVLFPNGKTYSASVKDGGEVILSAGVVKTPQILELSGIGDSNVLKPLGIPVKVDLPGVGANYEDHTLTILTYALKDGFLSFDALGYNATLAAEQTALYQQGKGWLTFAQAVTNFEPIEKVLTAAEIKEAKTILSTKPDSIPQDQFNIIKDQIFSSVPQVEFLIFNAFSGGLVKKANTSYISMAVTHLHPLSRGSIHINTTSINDHPKIDPNFLDSEWDKWFLAKTTAYGRKILQTAAFQEILDPEEVFPGAGTQTHDEWVTFIKQTVNSGYHSIGTASLLPKSKNGVVDNTLKVYGTRNIRVADTSIMPLHISAHTQTAAYAIGEKAASIILG